MAPELGMKMKDPVTGIEGTVTAVMHQLGGESQYRLEYISDGGAKDLWLPAKRFDHKPA